VWGFFFLELVAELSKNNKGFAPMTGRSSPRTVIHFGRDTEELKLATFDERREALFNDRMGGGSC
jgi:hypothetical protein